MIKIDDLLNKRIVIYGFGAYGKYLYNKLTSYPSIKIVAIIDDSIIEQDISKVNIYSLRKFVSLNFKYDLIILSSTYHKLLNRNLKNYNLKGFYFDLFRIKSKNKITVLKYGNSKLSFYTPNFLTELSIQNLLNTEPQTLNWINSFKSNKIFFDIGASNGCYSILTSLSKKIDSFAFEPDSKNFNLLSKNIDLNKNKIKGEISSFNIALDNANGILSLKKLEDYDGSHSKVLEKYDRKKNENDLFESQQNVLTFSLDHLVENNLGKYPNYIKIDVDGAEFSILEGAKKTLGNKALEQLLIETEIKNENNLIKIMEKYNFSFTEKHKIHEIIGGEIQGTMNYLFKK
mgnify:CR=1 FL=1